MFLSPSPPSTNNQERTHNPAPLTPSVPSASREALIRPVAMPIPMDVVILAIFTTLLSEPSQIFGE
jgi:hypothetical protein